MRKAKLFFGSLFCFSLASAITYDLFIHYAEYSSHQVFFKIGQILFAIILVLDPSPMFEVVKISTPIFFRKVFEKKLTSTLYFAFGLVVVLGIISLVSSVV